jgi:hypothetical protein
MLLTRKLEAMEVLRMIKYVFFTTSLLVLYLAYPASPRPNLSMNEVQVNEVQASPVRSGNCPTTPPPQAAGVGFTKLAYCLDGADPNIANLSTWMDCNYPNYTESFPHWQGGGAAGFCDNNHWNQTTDPTTKKTTLHFHWSYPRDASVWHRVEINQRSTRVDVGNFPSNHYIEIRMRSTDPTPGTNIERGQPDWALFSFTDSCGVPQPGNRLGCQSGNPDFFAYAPLEKDVFEIGGGYGTDSSAGLIDWRVNGGNYLMGRIENYISNYSTNGAGYFGWKLYRH